MDKILVFFVFGAILVAFLIASSDNTTEQMVNPPSFRPMVLNDRSYCQKIAEIAIYNKWTDLCGGNNLCQLKKSNASIATLYGELSFESCNARKAL